MTTDPESTVEKRLDVGGDAYLATTMNIYQGGGASGYRVARWVPAEVDSVEDLAPSQLLDVRNEVVPFYGRDKLRGDLLAWRDESRPRQIKLIHAPGGHGKTRLARQFAGDSVADGWHVGEAYADNSRHQPLLKLDDPRDAPGLLVIIDYAERWPTDQLLECCGRITRTGYERVRVLMLARPGSWWSSVRHTLVDIYRFRDGQTGLEAIATAPAERRAVFDTARDRFAKAMDVPGSESIQPPMDLSDPKFDSILEIHMAALVAIDAAGQGKTPPGSADELSEYLLRREQQHWSDMHRTRRIATTGQLMQRVVFVATLTGALPRADGRAALKATNLAGTTDGGDLILDDHRLCYPSPGDGVVLMPLYPDRLAEDFIALQLPAVEPDGGLLNGGPAVGGKKQVDEDWSRSVPRLLLEAEISRAEYRGRIYSVLSEAAQRFTHLLLEDIIPAPRAPLGPSPAEGEPAGERNADILTFRGALLRLASLIPARQGELNAMTAGAEDGPWRQLTAVAEASRWFVDAAVRIDQVTGPRRLELLTALHTVTMAKALVGTILEILPPEPSQLPAAAPGSALLIDVRIGVATEPSSFRKDDFGPAILAVLAETARSVPLSDVRVPRLIDRATVLFGADVQRVMRVLPEARAWLMPPAPPASPDLPPGSSLAAQQDTLEALSAILGTISTAGKAELPRPLARLAEANAAELEAPLVVTWGGAVAPRLEDGYIDPGYRLATREQERRIWDPEWWRSQPVRADISALLANYLLSPTAFSSPLLIIGDPGVGKSTLLTVLAARLPPDNYTAVRVPLRAVDPNSPIYAQVEQALEYSFGEKISWPELAVFGDTTLRVLLLDGVDELVRQAASRDSYLNEIAAFQRREAALGRPVAVVVTGRTTIADRTMLPAGSMTLKLEPFDDARVAMWLQGWNRSNARAIATGELRPASAEAVRRYREAVRIPLLLALAANQLTAGRDEPARPDVVDVYRSSIYALVDDHRREAFSDDDDRSTESVSWWLGFISIAAFNRGRRRITRLTVDEDLEAMRMEAGALDRDISRVSLFHGPGGGRSYEFWHAALGDFLVASHLIRMLREHAVQRRPGWAEPSDDLICALLSHEPLALHQQVLTFAEGLVAELSAATRAAMKRLLEALIIRAPWTDSARSYPRYRPTAASPVSKTATYTANLVLLRMCLDASEGIPLHLITPADLSPLKAWKSIVQIWTAGLTFDAWASMINRLELAGDHLMRRAAPIPYGLNLNVAEAELRGDSELAARMSNPPRRPVT
ncbi:NACHT domain-containing protein [Actinoplanes sp. NPDC049265]|uniref:NACHT domain-containing protein n=1 Tax=Actinoplanes sp. NPDC049265 TaxID=3363902 RepID=UPI003716FAAA